MAICLPNVPEYPIAVLGAHEAGLLTSLMNPMYNADEIARQLIMCNTKLIICTPSNYQEIKKACEIGKKNIPIVCIPFLKEQNNPEGAVNFFEIINSKNFEYIQSTVLKPEDIAVIPFSSGTTGLAKGVTLTHKNIVSNCEMVQTKLPTEQYVRETTDNFQDVIPCFLPFFHIYGLTICMMSKLHLGCQLVTFPKFTPQDLITSLTKHNGSLLNLAPPVLLMLTNSPNIKCDHFKSLRFVMTGAAPVGLTDAERFLSKFPNVSLSQGYGLTETSPAVILTPIGNTKYDSVGFPLPKTEIKIIPYQGSDFKGLEKHKSGEICIRGPQVMKGYLNNPEADADIFLPDSWLRTGDIGHYDDEGFFFITDRIKELIKVKGFQVPPAELEQLLRDHPKILDAAVFGITDSKSGEAPRALVVMKPGENLKEEEVISYVAKKVAPYKQLTGGVLFVNEIPKNAGGKILRRELKEKYGHKK
ncbi:uncharacterized protein LOC129613518 isoform X2 [Condylostylus longicornis]|nr:uncharacterized protein LOC129613518 isoform X2 [Condylostylus longicornis]XP_055387712.1 uncharacterized protein LOC129613518 isoform X2 [Condylostylus longicornis]